jgi:hypothetical protein
MDLGLIGFVISTFGGVIALVGVLVLAGSEMDRTDITGEVGQAEGPGLYLIYAGLVAIGVGIVVMLSD